MSKRDKLLRRIMQLDANMRFVEIRKVLETFGYVITFPRGGSSHATFRKPGHEPITIPTHEPIKVVYVRIVRDVILEEEGQ